MSSSIPYLPIHLQNDPITCTFGNRQCTENREHQRYKRSYFHKTSDAYVSFTQWNLCVYFDLKDHFEEIERLKEATDTIGRACDKIAVATNNGDNNCNLLHDKFADTYKSLKREADIILVHGRVKRSAPFEFVGKVMNVLTGVMTTEQAQAIDKRISSLENNLVSQEQLARDHISIIKGSITAAANNFKKIDSRINKIEFYLNKSEIAEATQVVNEISQIAVLTLVEHRHISNRINELLRDSVTGDVSDVIEIQMISDGLYKIQTLLREDEMLPIDLSKDNIHSIFGFTSIKGTLFNNRIMVEIAIPVLSRTKYSLFKSSPVPSKINDITFMLKTDTPFFHANLETGSFVPINNEDLANCKQSLNAELICHSVAPIRRDGVCEISLLSGEDPTTCNFVAVPHKSYLVTIENAYRFFVFPEKAMVIKQICQNSLKNTSTLNQASLLILDDDCFVHVDRYTLRSHSVKRLDMGETILAHSRINAGYFENSFNKTELADTIVLEDLEDLSDFGERLRLAGEERAAGASEVSKNDSIQYGLLLIVVIVIILVIAATYYIFSKTKLIADLVQTYAHAGEEDA